jgi:hypothetical protein
MSTVAMSVMLAFPGPRRECRVVRLSLALIVLVACSHPSAPTAPPKVASTWKGPAILAHVPADTPYMFGVIEPAPAAVRDMLARQSGDQVKQALKAAASGEGRAALVAAALYQELDGADPAHWLEGLGLSSDMRMVLYGMSLWPVLRVEIKDAVRVREVLSRIVKAGDPDLQPQVVGRAQMYVLKENKIAVVFGVVDRELVGAVFPIEVLDRALPELISADPPAHSMRDSKVLPALLAKHQFLPNMVAFADTMRVVDVLSGHGKGQLDQLSSLFEGKITPLCQDDLARVASVVPRFVLGYRRLDEHGFVAAMAIESPASVIKGLQKLHTPMPAMQLKTQPLFAFGAAVNVDEMFAWLRDVLGQMRAHPFRCDAFASANHAIDDAAAKLDMPLPPQLQGLRGFELVVDDATVMPPAGTGYLLVAGNHMADLIRQMLAQVPQLASLQLQPNGVALELPLDKLGLPSTIKSAHFALRETRAALAIGDSSATRASERVAAPEAHAPLMTVAYDLPKLRERFGMFLKESDFQNLSNVGSTSLALDVGDDGIYVDMVGTWAHGSR